MATLKLRYVHRFRDRHGKLRHYFRRRGYQRVALPGLPGSSEFMNAYQAALEGRIGGKRQIGSERAAPGTVAAAAAGYLQSLEFVRLAPTTQINRRRLLANFCAEHGDKPVRSLQTAHIKAMMAVKVHTPHAANKLLQTVGWIIKYSIEAGWRRDDPTSGIQRLTVDSDGYHSWSEEEIEQFELRWSVGTRQRLAFDLLLHTGQRSEDVRDMNRGQLADGVLSVRQKKTGNWVFIHVPQPLAVSLGYVPADQFVFLLNQYGKPFSEKGFGNYIVKAAQAAGLPQGCSAHGLRKAAAVRLAESGCTEHEIMSITGHTTLKEVERYTRAARMKLLAKGAVEKVRIAQAARSGSGSDV